MLCRLAGCPTRTSPLSVNATTEGVVRAPSAFSMTLDLLPSITATQEFVVPRSIPIAFVMTGLLRSRPLILASQPRPAPPSAGGAYDPDQMLFVGHDACRRHACRLRPAP